MKQKDILSESDWNTYKLGGSVKGFDLGKITWNDLGNKFMAKRTKRSWWACADPRSGAVLSNRSHTLNDIENFQVDDMAILSNDGAKVNKVLSKQLRNGTVIDTTQMTSNRNGTEMLR